MFSLLTPSCRRTVPPRPPSTERVRRDGDTRRSNVNLNSRSVCALIALLVALALPLTASAADRVRVGTGGKGAWDASAAWLGQKAGIFAKHGIDIEIFYTDGSGKALEAVIADSLDVALGVSVPNLIGAVV